MVSMYYFLCCVVKSVYELTSADCGIYWFELGGAISLNIGYSFEMSSLGFLAPPALLLDISNY